MPILDEITYKAAKLTEKTLDKSQELAQNAKIKISIASKQGDLNELLVKLGEYYYNSLSDIENLDEEVKPIVVEIQTIKEAIDKLNEQMK